MQWLPEAVFRYRVRGENAIKYLVYYFNRKITQNNLRKEYQHYMLEYDIKHRNIYKIALLRAATIRDRQGKRYLPIYQHCTLPGVPSSWRNRTVTELLTGRAFLCPVWLSTWFLGS
jgi:hypothetical protein